MTNVKSLRTKLIPFSSTGNHATVVYVTSDSTPDDIVKTLGIDLHNVRGVISINGGAKDWPGNNLDLHLLLEEGIAKIAAENSVLVVDGGTDIGVMSIIGIGVGRHGKKAPLIGIAPKKLVRFPNRFSFFPNSSKADLEPHHTHFILTPGVAWGDEIEFRSEFVRFLSNKLPSLSVVADGGDGTCLEALKDVRHGREIIVLKNSGRVADEIVRGLNHPDEISNENIAEIVKGNVTVFNIHKAPDELAKLLCVKLKLF